MANVYIKQGRYSEAELLLREALRLGSTVFGQDNYLLSSVLQSLGKIYIRSGQSSEAEFFLQEDLSLHHRLFNEAHPYRVINDFETATFYWAQEKNESAIKLFKGVLNGQESLLTHNLLGGSDANKRALISSLQFNAFLHSVVSIHLNNHLLEEDSAPLALNTIFQRKGRILDLFTNLRARLVDNSNAVIIFDELRDTIAQLSQLNYAAPTKLGRNSHLSSLRNLQQRVSELEEQLSHHSSDFAALAVSPTVEDIQSILPNNTALVEFIRYRPVNPTGLLELNFYFDENFESKKTLQESLQASFSEAHYAAYVFQKNGAIQAIDLGPAEEIDAAIEVLSKSLAVPGTPQFQVKEEAKVLEKLVMAPVRSSLGEITTVFIAPDSALNLIPFEAMVDESGNYLVENYQFRYLTSARDLMRINNNPASNNPAVLFGDPTFSRANETINAANEVAQRTIDLSENIFPRLGGTSIEIQEIAKQLTNSQVYLTDQATEAQLKAIDSPSILHIATHGFFSSEDNSPNPLLQSGLLLAGIKERQSGPDQDGILTALEVTSLDLQGTQLAVLSACETGLGELAAGEGIYGLRRALVLAGTQSQVISLWKVDDTATQELMVDYYDRLLAGAPRDAALRETQLTFLEHEEYSHPYYWSAFIGSGDWRSLN